MIPIEKVKKQPSPFLQLFTALKKEDNLQERRFKEAKRH